MESLVRFSYVCATFNYFTANSHVHCGGGGRKANEMSFNWYLEGPYLFPGCWCGEQHTTFGHSWSRMRFTFVLWVVHQSDKPNNIPYCQGCCYCHDCMFCFQPNELRWYHPPWDYNINEEAQKGPRSMCKLWWAYLCSLMNCTHTDILEAIFSQLTANQLRAE